MPLDVPVRATEQYPDRLGATVASLKDYPQAVLAKTSFSALDDPGFTELLPAGTSEIVTAPFVSAATMLRVMPGGGPASACSSGRAARTSATMGQTIMSAEKDAAG